MNDITNYRNKIGERILEALSHAESLFVLREDIINEENLLNSVYFIFNFFYFFFLTLAQTSNFLFIQFSFLVDTLC